MMSLACPRPRADACILIGGLGMGYTLAATLDLMPPGGTVVVSELVPEVVEWNRGPLGPLAGHPLDDPRTNLVVGDVADVIRDSTVAASTRSCWTWTTGSIRSRWHATHGSTCRRGSLQHIAPCGHVARLPYGRLARRGHSSAGSAEPASPLLRTPSEGATNAADTTPSSWDGGASANACTLNPWERPLCRSTKSILARRIPG